LRLFEHPDFEQAVLQAAEHFRERGLDAKYLEEGPSNRCSEEYANQD
jgi:hypothetical protein